MDIDYRKLLSKAIQIATMAHGDTISKDDTPYILHPMRLMMKANGYPEKIVSILHDTIEDTHVTWEDLGFLPVHIRIAIEKLTRLEGQSYDDYISRISENPLAVSVKILDLEDNINLLRLSNVGSYELERAAKYHRAWLKLIKLQRGDCVILGD